MEKPKLTREQAVEIYEISESYGVKSDFLNKLADRGYMENKKPHLSGRKENFTNSKTPK